MRPGAAIGMKKRTSHTAHTNLKAIVRAYVHRIRPRAQAELDWFSRQPSLTAAIEKAALAVNSGGKRYSHQRRLKKVALVKALRNLLNESEAMGHARDFDALFKIIRTAVKPTPGIGELYVYDTSLRIGAKLNLFPTRVYLHAGTRLGARALGLNVRDPTLTASALPREFHLLEPHELEDVLCIFKKELWAASNAIAANDVVRRSWCG